MIKRKIPYGISNFERLKVENYLYVDKTKYVEILEDYAPYQFFIRPRRFGKSLFISMLENYYDINKQHKFQNLFGDLYIGQNPTSQKNSYLVLLLSFASIVTSEGKERLIKSFDNNVLLGVQSFVSTYREILKVENIPAEITGAEMAIRFIVAKAYEAEQKIFILIDEYDNFASDLIGTGKKDLYSDLLSSEGYVRAFYKALKDGTQKSIARVFMTGVSPIMLDDLTSGFNITVNLTLERDVNEMVGFTEQEIKEITQELELDKQFDEGQLNEDIRKYYNGYMFNEEATCRLYNSDMVLYFFNALYKGGKYPKNMMDENVKTDYRKLQQLAFNFRDEDTIENLMANGMLTTRLVDRFRLEQMYTSRENFISLLFYMGMLTIKQPIENEVELIVPNYVTKAIYWEYFLDKLKSEVDIDNQRLKGSIRKMRLEGEITDFADYVREVLQTLSNRDLIKFNENQLKIMLITLFSVDGIYIIHSEHELETGYADIMLTKDLRYEKSINYEWIIELKYLKEEDRGRLEEVRRKGIEQLVKYGDSGKVKSSLDSIRKVLITVVGKKDIYAEVVN